MNRLKFYIATSFFYIAGVFCASQDDPFAGRDKTDFNSYLAIMLQIKTIEASDIVDLEFEIHRAAILKNLEESDTHHIKDIAKHMMNSLFVYTPQLNTGENKIILSIAKQLFPGAIALKNNCSLDVQMYKWNSLREKATFLFKYMHASDMGNVYCQYDINKAEKLVLCLQGFTGISSSKKRIAPIYIQSKKLIF